MLDRPRLLCLDVATTTGLAEGVVGERPSFETVCFAKSTDDHEDVFGRATAWAATRLKLWKPDYIFIEAPIAAMMYGSTNADTGMRLIGLWAAIAGVARARNIICRRANIQQVRQLTLGSGRLKSEDAKRMARGLCDKLGWNVHSYDESDAAMVFLWASYQVCPAHATRVEPVFLQKVG